MKKIAQKMEYLLSLDAETKEKYGKILRAYVVWHHSLDLLARRLTNE